MEDLLPGGVPSLAVRHFRSCKAGVEAYDGSLPPKTDFFSSSFFFFFLKGLKSAGTEELHFGKESLVRSKIGTVQCVL